jgi:hypothetical protein
MSSAALISLIYLSSIYVVGSIVLTIDPQSQKYLARRASTLSTLPFLNYARYISAPFSVIPIF